MYDAAFMTIFYIFVILQIAVPRHSVGVVIGRNGEMIKKIQSDAGVKIQFKPGKLSKGFVQDKTESNLWLGHRQLSLSSRVMK